MKKTKKKQKKSGGIKFGYIFLIAVLVAGITFLGLSIFMPKKPRGDDDRESNAVVNETENKNTTTEPDDGSENPDKTPKQYEEDDETDKSKINASITRNDVENGKYYLRLTIYEKLGTGTCSLHMETNKGDSIDRSAQVIEAGADSSSCEGFDIPTSEISSGTYDFTVTIKSGEKTGSVKGTIKI